MYAMPLSNFHISPAPCLSIDKPLKINSTAYMHFGPIEPGTGNGPLPSALSGAPVMRAGSLLCQCEVM